MDSRNIIIHGDSKYTVNITGDNNQVINIYEHTTTPPTSRADLLDIIHHANAPLRSCRNTIAGIHLDRPEVDEIVAWATDADTNQRLGMLLDQPGGGKTVVLRDVLERLEKRHVAVLAIKSDLLSGVRTPLELANWLGLPDRVDKCVQQLASEGLFVLLLDQLDALSLALTRDQATLDVILDLLARLREIPDVRIIASCRTFDLHNDLRLSGIKLDREFRLRPLEDGQVAQVLRAVGVDLQRLLPAHRTLLKTPLHLDVYVRTLPDEQSRISLESFQSLQELYAALWRIKIASPASGNLSSTDLNTAIYRLVDAMITEKQTNAPEALLDDLAEAARYLEREGLLQRERNRWSFFHQTFLDYCYARRFVVNSRSLSHEVLKGPQGLFERSLIVQVLAYLRGTETASYERELTALLFAPGLRVHLRLLILGWLGALPDPADSELAIVRRWATDSERQAQLLNAFSGNAAWFDWLNQGLLSQWLTNDDEKPLNATVVYLRKIINARPAAVFEHLMRFIGRNQEWDAAVSSVLSDLTDWNNEQAIDLLCNLLARGATFGHENVCLHNMAESNPAGGCRALRAYLDYRLNSLLAQEAAMPGEEVDPSQVGRAKWLDWLQWERELVGNYAVGQLMSRAAQAAPEAVIEHLMPWLLRAISAVAHELSEESPLYRGDALFSRGWYEEHPSESAMFAVHMAQALASVARRNPARFRDIATDLMKTEWLTVHRMLAQAYLADPATYLDEILDYLMADRRRLFLGDGGDAHHESRMLFASAFTLASPAQRLDLEALILDWQPRWERQHLRGEGAFQVAFLTSVPREMLSERARRRRLELEHKFPDYKPPTPWSIEDGVVGPPIEPAAQEKMSDRAWLSAMRKYDDSTGWDAPKREFLKGGVIELARSFEEHVKKDPKRFYYLAQQLDEQISLHYVTAAISGLADSDALADWVFDLVRRNAARLRGEFRRMVCWALEKRAATGIPDDILDMIADWALNDPDPTEARCLTHASSEQDVYQLGINTNRGAAVRTLVKCSVQREPPQIERAFALLEQTAADPSTAVRTCVIDALTQLLTHDRERTFEIFEKTMAEQPRLLESPVVHNFLYWCLWLPFVQVRPFIEALLASSDAPSRRAGARLACLAAFRDPAAQPLTEQVLTGDAAMRVGAAEVYARNLEFREIQPVCEANLRKLMNDLDESVREEVGKCFDYLRPEHFSSLRPFIKDFLDSPSFRAGAEHLVRYLKSVALDDYDLTLAVIERILDELGNAVLDIRTHWAVLESDLVQLSLNVYHHAVNERIKMQAMDLFERLLMAGSCEAYKALDEWDRR
jgi:hypothetical protein